MRFLALLAAVMVVFSSLPSVAQPSIRNAPREKRIEDQLASIAPNAVAQFQAATRALDAGDNREAVRLYRLSSWPRELECARGSGALCT